VTDALIEALETDRYDLVVANFANADMVGHTGVWGATVRAVETVDGCLDRIVAALDAHDALDPDGAGSLLAITADHGNADQMRDGAGNPVTAHSLNPVPFLLAGRAVDGRRLRDGVLADVTPTLIELAGLPRWDGLIGRSLLEPGGGTSGDPVLSSDAVPTGGRPQ
jgi:2,3-bisphosphoglycerate-independent phosphoglycerate mutase